MKSSYQIHEPDKTSTQLATEIVTLLVEAGITYQQADDAICAARELLGSGTKPTLS